MITVVLGVVALLAWAGFEVVFRAPGAASDWRGDARDRASTPLIVAAAAAGALVPIATRVVAFGSLGQATWVAWAGVAACAAGLALRAWGMRMLGASYTRTLRTASGQRLVTSGPYRWIRHPGYAGSIAVWIGAALAFQSWLAAAIVAALLALAYGWRIRSEERMLLDHFGDEYRAYAARTSRVIPKVC